MLKNYKTGWRSRALVSLIAVGGAVATIGAVSAHTGSPFSGIIHACVKNGHITVVAAAEACTSANGVAMDWNAAGATGATGPAGPTGATGPAGAPGAAGPSGVASLQTRTATSTTPAGGWPAPFVALTTRAACLGNEKVTGGGHEFDAPNLPVIASRPYSAGGVQGWEVRYMNYNAVTTTVYAICAAA